MSSPDSFRRTTWTAADAVDFHARLRRSRSSKAQYVRIQALHLAKVGQHEAALSLLDQLFRDFPEPCELAQSYLQKAGSLAVIGREEEAIVAFFDCLAAQRDRPNVKTNGAIDFAWFVVQRQIKHLYDDAATLVDQYEADSGDWLPIQRYMCATIRALLAIERNDIAAAREFAGAAAKAAAETHSGLRYHSTIGLVSVNMDASVRDRLAAIGDM